MLDFVNGRQFVPREKWEHWHCGSCGVRSSISKESELSIADNTLFGQNIYELKGRIREASEFPEVGRNSPADYHTVYPNSGEFAINSHTETDTHRNISCGDIEFTCDNWAHGDDEGVLITYTLPLNW